MSDTDDSMESDVFLTDDDDNMETSLLETAFGEVAHVVHINDYEYHLEFSDTNVILIEDDENYVFETKDGVPVLQDVKFFIVFCNKLKNLYLNLTGIKLTTNLEGGGELVI